MSDLFSFIILLQLFKWNNCARKPKVEKCAFYPNLTIESQRSLVISR